MKNNFQSEMEVWLKLTTIALLASLVLCENESRIVGGNLSPEGGFPYQASVRKSETGSHICGGAIINLDVILTTAHCVSRLKPSQLTVVVGTNTLNSGGLRYGVASIRSHKWYNRLTIKNNIAILKLANSVTLSPTVKTIPLETSNIGADVAAILSGWGLTSQSATGEYPNDLRDIILKTISLSSCKRRHFLSKVDKSHICTFTKRGEGACVGDSGGPLVSNGFLIGIVSWGRPCGVGYPDVFTRISYYVDWINKNSV